MESRVTTIAAIPPEPNSDLAQAIRELAREAGTRRGNIWLRNRYLHIASLVGRSEVSLKTGNDARHVLEIDEEAAWQIDNYINHDRIAVLRKRVRNALCDILDSPHEASDRELQKEWRRFNLRTHPDKGSGNPEDVADHIRGQKMWSVLKELSVPISDRLLNATDVHVFTWTGPMEIANQGDLQAEITRQRALRPPFVLSFPMKFIREVAPLHALSPQLDSARAAAVVAVHDFLNILKEQKLTLDMFPAVGHALLRKLSPKVMTHFVRAFLTLDMNSSTFCEMAVNSFLSLHADISDSMEYIVIWIALSYLHRNVEVSAELGVKYGAAGMSRILLYNAYDHELHRKKPRDLCTGNRIPGRHFDDEEWTLSSVDKVFRRYMRMQEFVMGLRVRYGARGLRCLFSWEEGLRQFPCCAIPECSAGDRRFSPEELLKHLHECHGSDTDISAMLRCVYCSAPYPCVEDAILQRFLELSHLVECRSFPIRYSKYWKPETAKQRESLLKRLQKYSIADDIVQEMNRTRTYRLTTPVKCLDGNGAEHLVFSIKR